MDGKPLVSIVIPVYNREDLVKEAIESALAQTYDNVEIVIVDNCSTDNTWGVISSYSSKKIRAFKNETNIGPVLNWKRGVELSKGEYVKLLFSDDLISNNFIEESLAIFDEDVAFVISPIKKIKKEELGNESPYSKREYKRKNYFFSFCTQFSDMFPVSPGASLFRKKDVEKAFICDIPTMGELNPMKNGAGIDLLIYFSIASKYPRIRISEKSNALFRDHEGSFSVSDNSIIHYYFRAMIYFFLKMQDRKYSLLFKAFLIKHSNNGNNYREEYEMIPSGSLFNLYYPFLFIYLGCYNLWNRAIRKYRKVILNY